MTEAILFARIGWMKYYEGSGDDDPRPIGGGAFNDENFGGESRNFLVRRNSQVPGFVHSGKKQLGKIDGLNLKRLDPACPPLADLLRGVFVIFLATVPLEYQEKLGKGTRVVARTHRPGTTIWRLKNRSEYPMKSESL